MKIVSLLGKPSHKWKQFDHCTSFPENSGRPGGRDRHLRIEPFYLSRLPGVLCMQDTARQMACSMTA